MRPVTTPLAIALLLFGCGSADDTVKTGGGAGARSSIGGSGTGGSNSGGTAGSLGGGGTAAQVCIPGHSRGCTGDQGCSGFEVCQSNGKYGPCQCGTGGRGGSTSSGGMGGGGMGGSTGGAGAAGGGAGAGGTPSGGAGGSGGVGGGSTAEVLCGDNNPVTCAPGDLCCNLSNGADTCVADANDCTCSGFVCQAIVMPCDGPEDCASGEVCCAKSDLSGTKVACSTSCGGLTAAQLCHTDADCGGSTPRCSVNPVTQLRNCSFF